MTTATQTKRYDRGYEDAIEGRKPRANDEFYLKGYQSARRTNPEECGIVS
jgi:hypothetical protein